MGREWKKKLNVGKQIIVKVLGVFFLFIILLVCFDQNPFPGLEVKLNARQKVMETVVVKEKNYRTYLLISKNELFQTTFKRGDLFWGENINYFLDRNKPITIDYLSMDEEQYAIVYGCCNDKQIVSAEFIKHDGGKISLELSKSGIFYEKIKWSELREIRAYDLNGNMVYQQHLNSATSCLGSIYDSR